MNALVNKLKSEVKRAEAEAASAWSTFEKFREEKGEDALADDTAAFDEAHSMHKAYGEKAQAAETLRDKLVKAFEMAGERKDNPGSETKDDEGAGERKHVSWHTVGQKAASLVVESDEYKALKESGYFERPSHQVGDLFGGKEAVSREEFKTLVMAQTGTTGDILMQPDRQGGIIQGFARKPRVLLNLVGIGDTDSDTVEWIQQDSVTNSAAERPEATATNDTAADAPESGFVLSLKTTPVQEIVHYIPATKTALADVGQLRTIIDFELLEGLQDRLESQILNGNGTAPNLRGILNTSGILTQAQGADPTTEAVLKALTKVVLQGYDNPTVMLNPSDWQLIRLSKDGNGNYYYGPPNIGGPTTMWGYSTVMSQWLTAGTGLVGDFARGATLWMRQGASISATDSHSDWFLRRIIAIMASMRAAFGVQRPKAFCTVTGIV